MYFSTGLEFAFTQAPPSMQGFLTGIFFAASGVGNYVSSAIVAIITAITKSGMFPVCTMWCEWWYE